MGINVLYKMTGTLALEDEFRSLKTKNERLNTLIKSFSIHGLNISQIHNGIKSSMHGLNNKEESQKSTNT